MCIRLQCARNSKCCACNACLVSILAFSMITCAAQSINPFRYFFMVTNYFNPNVLISGVMLVLPIFTTRSLMLMRYQSAQHSPGRYIFFQYETLLKNYDGMTRFYLFLPYVQSGIHEIRLVIVGFQCLSAVVVELYISCSLYGLNIRILIVIRFFARRIWLRG